MNKEDIGEFYTSMLGHSGEMTMYPVFLERERAPTGVHPCPVCLVSVFLKAVQKYDSTMDTGS